MKLSVFLPPLASAENKVPALYWLSGLTCNHENFAQKSGAQQFASQHNIALIACDTSPRGVRTEGDDLDWTFGQSAGYYCDATASPWCAHYRMYSYVTQELPAICEANLPISSSRSISGHSMGGMGALAIFLRNSQFYRSVSAFAPIAAPLQCEIIGKLSGSQQQQNERYKYSRAMHFTQYANCLTACIDSMRQLWFKSRARIADGEL